MTESIVCQLFFELFLSFGAQAKNRTLIAVVPRQCTTIVLQEHIGTPCLIRTDSQLLLRESALPISVKGHISKHTSRRESATPQDSP